MVNENKWVVIISILANITQIILAVTQFINWNINVFPIPPYIPPLLAIFCICLSVWYITKEPIYKSVLNQIGRKFPNDKLLAIATIVVSAISLVHWGIDLINFSTHQKIIVLVTNFQQMESINSSDQTVSQLIFDSIKSTMSERNDVEVIYLHQNIQNLTPESAIDLGRSKNARIVIWGWYSLRQNEVLINPHFEILSSEHFPKLPFSVKQEKVPRAFYESFEFEQKLSNDYSLLSMFVVSSIRYSQGNYEYVIEFLLNNLDKLKNQNNIDAIYNQLGLAYFHLEKNKEAEYYFRMALEQSPNDSTYIHNVGTSLLDSNRDKEAEEFLRKAIVLDPNSASSFNSLGVLYSNKDMNSVAESYFQQAINMRPKNIIYRENLVWLYIDEKEYKKALVENGLAIKSDPTNSELFLIRSFIYQKMEFKIHGAICMLISIFLSNPILIILLLLEFVAIFYILHKVIKNTDSFVANLLLSISSIMLFIFGYKKFRKNNRNLFLSKILENAVMLRLTSYDILRDANSAKSLVESAATRGIKNRDILMNLGIFYFTNGDQELAKNVFLDVLRENQNTSLACFYLGHIYRAERELSTAIKYYKKSIPSEYEGAAWFHIGDLLWICGDYRGSLICWKKAVDRDANVVIFMSKNRIKDITYILSPIEHYKLGLAYYHQGNKINAKTGFEIASKEEQVPLVSKYASRMLNKCV